MCKSYVLWLVAGNRNNSNGSLNNVGSNGNYWSSTVSGTNASNLNFNSSNSNMNTNNRANGFSVRCLKDCIYSHNLFNKLYSETYMKLVKIILAFYFGFFALQSTAQQPVDSLAAVYTPYRTAMGILKQSQAFLPQDSVAFANEWQRLNKHLNQVSDSVALANPGQGAIYFELQRKIDLVTYNTHTDSLQPRLHQLYTYVAKHQTEIVENAAQFTKVAECLMVITSITVTNELPIAAFNAGFALALYKQLNTQDWDHDKRKTFFSFFAFQYAKTGNIRMTEKFYRHVDSLWVKDEEQAVTAKQQFLLTDTVKFQNGFLQPTGKSWQNLRKGKMLLYPQHQDLYTLVYLVSNLRAFDKAYRALYDVVILYDSTNLSPEYLTAIKQNLTFGDYYLAAITPGTGVNLGILPAAMLLSAENEVVYKTQNLNALFKKLNEPIEVQQDKEKALYDADLAQQKEALQQKALAMADSTQYKVMHSNITFTLKGLWEEGLTTELTPVRYSETDTLPDTTKPYMAMFTVVHPQYVVYQLLVLVNHKPQEIIITSGNLYKKTVSHPSGKVRKYQGALATIDQSLTKQANYALLQKSYPFKQTPFIRYIKKQEAAAKKLEKTTIKHTKGAKKILQRYAEVKRKEFRQM
jgi:hypothetical protein